MSALSRPLVFRLPHEIREVVLVGLGGTGSQWARGIARTLYHLKRLRRHIPRVTFIDPDTVEAKNVGRQMFTDADIGAYKSEVLATRFNRALGLDISFYNAPFDAERYTAQYGTVICGAVDNHLARRELTKLNCVWIDAGNHFAAGQVCIGNTSNLAELQQLRVNGNEITRLPNAALLFPSLLEPDPMPIVTPTPSCAEAVELDAQMLLINDVMGSVAADYTYRLLNHQPISSFLTYVDLSVCYSVKSVPISAAELRPYLTLKEQSL